MAKLIPADKKRCQVEWKGSSFMTLGPPNSDRCKNIPSVIVTEKKAIKGCQKGSMSLCAKHFKVFLKHDNRSVKIIQLKELKDD